MLTFTLPNQRVRTDVVQLSRRKKYSKEFKLDAVSLVLDRDYCRAEPARSLGLKSNMLGRWVSEHRTDGRQSFRGNGKLTPKQEKIRKLRSQVKNLKMEKEILKNRITARLRLAATTVGRTDTALGAFYRRLSARIGKAKAVTATARKIAILFYNAMRYGMDYQDPGANHYERDYRKRVVKGLHRRAAEFGYSLHEIVCVS